MLVLQLHNFRFETWERWRRKGHGAGDRHRLPPSPTWVIHREYITRDLALIWTRPRIIPDLSALKRESRTDPSVHGTERVPVYVFTRGSLTGQSALLIQSNMYERIGYQKFAEKHRKAFYVQNTNFYNCYHRFSPRKCFFKNLNWNHSSKSSTQHIK